LFGKTPLKAQNDYIFQNVWGVWPLWLPPGYAYARLALWLVGMRRTVA